MINIYEQLSSIPHEIADKITNAKTGGGRSLNAIYDSKLSTSEKILMLFLGGQLNYTKDFINQYRYVSLNTIAEKISMTKQSVLNLLNGYKNTKKVVKGLIEKGYINKLKATVEEQMKGWSNHYCISSKIFDEYIESMIDEYKTQNPSSIPSQIILPPPSNHLTPPSQTILPKVPVFNNPSQTPSLNAAKQPAAALKKKKTAWKQKPTEMKTWENKSEEEKFKSLIDITRTVHRDAVNRKKAFHFEFDDIPDLLKPLIELHGFEVLKSFLEQGRNERRGYNVRFLGQGIREWLDNKDVRPQPILPKEESQPESALGDKIIKQVERNMIVDKKEFSEKISKLPEDFQNWYTGLSRLHQKSIERDLIKMSEVEINAYFKSILQREKKASLSIARNSTISIGMG